MKRSSWRMIWLAACLALSACGPGQAFGPTLTPTPTITLTQTATITPIPTLTPTPTITLTPTLTPFPYAEGLAYPLTPDENHITPDIPSVSRTQDLPRLYDQILAKGIAMGGWFSADAPKVTIYRPYVSSGNTEWEIQCPAGACKIVGTVQLAGETSTRNGQRQEIHPVIQIWVLNTESGPAVDFVYSLDEVENPSWSGYRDLLANIQPDGSFPYLIRLMHILGLNTFSQGVLPWYQSLLSSPAYADVRTLADEADTSESLSTQLQLLILQAGAIIVR